MSKFNCTCGHVSSNVQTPTAHEARLITDTDLDNYTNYGNKPATISCNIPMRTIIECAKCGRIWVQSKTGRAYISFIPEGAWLGLVSESAIVRANKNEP